MTFEAVIVLVLILAMLVLLIFEVFKPETTVFLTIVLFIFLGILTPQEALVGFSNQAVMTIALLFIITSALQRSDLVERVMKKILEKSKSPRSALVYLMLPTSFLSSFLNNTPIVMMLIPTVRKWCQEKGISAAKFLLPISYAAIFGGVVTLIGTSTNLVVHGMLLEEGMPGFTMFQLAWVGIPATLAGILYMYLVGYHLLPNRDVLQETLYKQTRDYLTQMIVRGHSPWIGKKVKDTEIFSQSGIHLIKIIRKNKHIAPITGNEIIQEDDRLIFSGIISSIVKLQEVPGVEVITDSTLTIEDLRGEESILMEVVISKNSLLADLKVRETNFRQNYGASIIAVHRNRQRLSENIGNVQLHVGDVLLILAEPSSVPKIRESRDFYLLSQHKTSKRYTKTQLRIIVGSFIGMIALATVQVVSMFEAALLAFCVLLFSRCVTGKEILKALNFPVLLLVACSIALGGAITKTGLATYLAEKMIELTLPFGAVGVLIASYLLTGILTEVVTNTAAAVIMFPIVLEASLLSGLEPMAGVIALTVAASASFVTPIGYQTNLIVYNAGGYRFIDFIKVGIPLNITFMIITVGVLYLLYL